MVDHTDIRRTIEWYSGLSRDFSDIDTPMSARRRLSTALFALAIELGEAKKEANRTEFQRRAAHARTIKRISEAGKTSMALAETLAQNETEQQRSDELATDALYTALKLLYDAAMNVCDVMGQHISNLKAEKAFV